MPSIKNRSYGLNLRRTYDVFKDPVKEDDTRSVRPQMEGEEVLVDKGDNRMTLNQKFKDFLLNWVYTYHSIIYSICIHVRLQALISSLKHPFVSW